MPAIVERSNCGKLVAPARTLLMHRSETDPVWDYAPTSADLILGVGTLLGCGQVERFAGLCSVRPVAAGLGIWGSLADRYALCIK